MCTKVYLVCIVLTEPGLQRLSPFTPKGFDEIKELERRLHDHVKLKFLMSEDHFEIDKNDAFPFRDEDFDNTNRMTLTQQKLKSLQYIQHCQRMQILYVRRPLS